MSRVKKIIKIIFIFIIVMLFLCFIFSFCKYLHGEHTLSEVFDKTGLYFLYMIGYGALEGDAFLQNLFAMIGIVSLALLTTFLTLNLFWRFEDVALGKEIIYDDKTQQFFFQLINKGQAICDMKVSFMLYDTLTSEDVEGSKDYFMPLLLEHTSWKIKASLEDPFWYEAIQNILKDSTKQLYCTFSFVDTKSGQESIRVEEIKSSNLKNKDGKEISLQMLHQPIVLKGETLQWIENGGSMKIEKQNQLSKISYQQLNQVAQDQFMMFYYSFVQHPINLEKYDSSSYITFSIQSQTKMHLNLEIKTMDSAQFTYPIQVEKEKKQIQINFSEIPIELLEVKEICFTIKKEGNPTKNQILLSNLKIVVH